MTDKKKVQIAIGKRIKMLRENKNISQQDIAGLCNIEKSNFSRLEAGNTNPTIYTLSIIAKHLNIPLSELVDIKN
ncbi:helix-turn-helix domain-containing protein [Tamlana agarivorans]|uniref:Helix-turn-helix domain-containing protein n=1 Tax=Pseudotamlana agarivorans TaxID=481183 RepID=A0ACC5U5V8_9FLAO|nr:helix-turn-helix transcriptional regulator [Tamlana agarivorans]MBU2949713.1 helix-turn-helix domain-containing protein [Tamlana agarivorans]